MIEQLVERVGEDVPPPRPPPDLGEAALVDVEDHDALVHAARHGHGKARVVEDVVEAGDELQAPVGRRVKPQRVANEKQCDRKAENDPCEVLPQVRPSRRIPS